MIWLTNCIDPRKPGDDPNRYWHGKDREKIDQFDKYLKGKRIGPPKATEYFNQEQMIADGYVGIYELESGDNPDELLRNTPAIRNTNSPSRTPPRTTQLDKPGLSQMQSGESSVSTRI
jgi:hypothetical protein